MGDDPLARARQTLQRAKSVASEGPGATEPILIEAIEQLADGMHRLEQREHNLAVQQALLDDRLLRVERNRLFTTFHRVVTAGLNLLQKVKPVRAASDTVDAAEYAKWVAHESATFPSVEQARAASNLWRDKPTLSVVIVARSGEVLRECLESLERQAYQRWELCVAANKKCEGRLSGFAGEIRTVAADTLEDSEALNAAAALATGEYLCVLPETGTLSPLALYFVAEALQRGPFEILYSDEDFLDSERRRERPLFKPDWSPDLLLSSLYLGNLLILRRESFLQAGGLSGASASASLLDLVLRLADQTVRVHHIPKVLYHGASTSSAARAHGSAELAITKAAPQRRSSPSSAAMTAIVCSRSPDLLGSCLESLRETAKDLVRQIVVVAHEESGPNPELHAVIQKAGAVAVPFSGAFDFAAMNNLGAARAEAANLLFVNDDVRATGQGWAQLLSEQISREEIGVVGAVLRYPTGVLQHAGVVVGIGDGVGHAGRYMYSSELWPWLLTNREVSAVTGACMAIRKELFEQLDGFDLLFPNNYNDVDLCFRVRSLGYRVICVAADGLVHAECQSRPGIVRFEERYRFYERWAALLGVPDPYYSPALAPAERIALNLTEDLWYRSLLRPI